MLRNDAQHPQCGVKLGGFKTQRLDTILEHDELKKESRKGINSKQVHFRRRDTVPR